MCWIDGKSGSNIKNFFRRGLRKCKEVLPPEAYRQAVEQYNEIITMEDEDDIKFFMFQQEMGSLFWFETMAYKITAVDIDKESEADNFYV